jgi:predicted acetylornithine/succinylornithine family transaminase
MKPSPYDQYFVPTYARSGAPMIRGSGVYLYDAAGKKYLDFGTGIAVNALGHAHPALIRTLKQQGPRLLHASNLYFTQTQIDLVQLLIKHSFGDRVFLCNSGTEAMEAAIKFSRKWGTAQSKNKYHILSFADGFHGRTYGALSATAQEKFHAGFGPMMQGFHYAPLNDIKATKKMLDKHAFAAIIIEPIQGESGINPASNEFLRFLRQYATRKKIALVFDEIQCGLGRTGTLWNYQQHKIEPDLMAVAKPLGGGLPLGAVICKEEFVAKTISPGDHGTTFGGNPLACALGCEVVRIISDKKFLKNVRDLGWHLKDRLIALSKRNPAIKAVRGNGLLVGAELDQDPKKIVAACREHGLLVIKAEHNTVRFLPPLIVTGTQIDAAVAIFEKVLDREAENKMPERRAR